MHEPIPQFLDRTKLVLTYTNLNCYAEVCPHQFYRRYILKDLPFEETDAMRWGTAVHLAMEKRVRAGAPLPVEMQKWESLVAPLAERQAVVELKLGIRQDGSWCDFWAKDVWVRGKIDVVLMPPGPIAAIFDHKTGGSKFERPFELAIGALMLRAKYPHLTTIKGRYIWLKEDRIGGEHDLSDTEATMTEVKAIASQIEHNRSTGVFAKTPSGLCGFCDVMDCQYNRKQQ